MFDSNDGRTEATERKFEELAAPAVGASPIPLFWQFLIAGYAPLLFISWR